jgi:hypothetical protein
MPEATDAMPNTVRPILMIDLLGEFQSGDLIETLPQWPRKCPGIIANKRID